MKTTTFTASYLASGMNKKVIKNYERYCKKTQAELDSLKYLDTQLLQKQHFEGKWTIIQILDHLLIVEKEILLSIQKKSAEPTLKTVKMRNHFYAFLVKIYLRSGKKVKAPSILPEPTNTAELMQLRQEFDVVRKNTLDFIKAFPDDKKNKLIFRHPLAGMFTLKQTVSFLADHWDHHQPQIKKLKSAF